MAATRRTADSARAEVGEALADGRRRTGGERARAVAGPLALMALQRSAGNAAVSALMAAKAKSPGDQAVGEIDAALREIKRDEPAIDTVEKGLKQAKAAGVPVELEGPKPPASALAVTTTGFGPASVPAKKPVPPAKPVPAKHPLGKAGAAPAKGGHAPAPVAAPVSAAAPPIEAPAPLTGDQLLQPPVAPEAVRPEDDPAFTQVTGNVKGFAGAKKAHPPAASKAKEAQDAALAPTDDVAGQAKAAKVDTMDAQQAGTFDKKAFIAAVKTAIEAKSPKTLVEATDPGKTGQVKGEVKGLVTQGKDGQAKDVEAATDAPPDQSKAVPKPVTPMSEEQPGQASQIPAAGAVPKPAPPEQVNLEAGKQQANQELADAEVSEPQLAQSNEPEFQQALSAKQAAAAHADSAPGEYRAQEQQVLQQGKAEAAAQTTAGVQGMQGAKGAALAHLVADKGKTKSKDEAKRAEVTTKIQGIFAATEAEVKKILDGIDPKVEAAFEQGEAAARSAFESFVAAKMAAYKEDRYSGWLGGLRWAKDKLLGMPSKVNEFYEAGRELYLKQMDGVISRVADIVGNDLIAAKQRIAGGKTEIASYVKTLSPDLQKIGAEASKEIGDKFAQLESDVNDKQESVVDTLATKYTESRKGLDERIEALQAENQGLVDAAVGAIKGVINTIRELASMLKDVLSRAAGVVGDIIKNPISFLGNLIAGVKGGILKFKDNILDHLRKGLMSWLFGALAEGGVELPDKFDMRGIIKLLTSIFGLTWANIRNRLVKQIGEKAMSAAEKGVEIFQVMVSQGVAGLWQMLIEKLGDIKEMILDQVKDFVITKIITAGITWLIGLLNPAAAFIKACKLIYDVIMFFVNNGSRIMKFVNTVIDSVADIVRGNVSGVVGKINDVLGQMVPIIIGFLASAIGLGGIGAKIRSIIETLQKPVNKALDFVIKTGLKLAGPIIRGIKGIGGKIKAKLRGGDDSPEGKQKRLDKGMAAALSAVRRFSGKGASEKLLKPLLAGIRIRYGLAVLRPVEQGRVWAVHGQVNPEQTTTTDVPISDEVLRKSLEAMHGRVHGILKECKRWAKGNAKATPVVKLGQLQKAFDDQEPKYRRLASLSREDQLTLRTAYVQVDEQGDALFSDLKKLDGVTTALQQVHDQTRSLKNELAKRFKKTSPPSWTEFGTAYESAEKAYKRLWEAGDDDALAAARSTWNDLHSRAQGIQVDLDKPDHLQTDQVRAKAETALAAATALLSSGEVPQAKKKEIEGAVNSLRHGLNGLGTSPQPSQLLPISTATDRLTQLATSLAPKPEEPAEVQAKQLIASITSVLTDTSKAGRPDADVGTGSTEEAVAKERQEATPYKTREGHWTKLRDAITSLKNSSTALKALQPSITERALVSEIETVTKEADKRRTAMETEYAAWQKRVQDQTGPEASKLWYTDEAGNVRSKLIPTWPSPEPRK